MIVPAVVITKFTIVQPYISYVADAVKQSVLSYCESNGFAYTSRTKTPESLAEKLETGRYTSWSQVDDLFACSIIIPTLVYEAGVLEYLEKAFLKVNIRKRGETQKDPAIFRFDATRFIGRLNLPAQADVNDAIRTLLFEVQIRTAFEHAWSVTTHALAYKADKVNWQSLRLAAQLKASVEQLDGLVMAFEQAAEVVQTHPWPETKVKGELEMLFKDLIETGAIPTEFTPGNWQRFCDNIFNLLRAGSKNFKFRIETIMQQTETAIRSEVADLGLSKFPRSISLLQFVLGVLTSRGVINGPYLSYTPLITDQLLLIYPQVGDIKEHFIFEE